MCSPRWWVFLLQNKINNISLVPGSRKLWKYISSYFIPQNIESTKWKKEYQKRIIFRVTSIVSKKTNDLGDNWCSVIIARSHFVCFNKT